MMTASPSKHYSGHCKATEEQNDGGTLGIMIWRMKCGRQAQVQLDDDGGSS